MNCPKNTFCLDNNKLTYGILFVLLVGLLFYANKSKLLNVNKSLSSSLGSGPDRTDLMVKNQNLEDEVNYHRNLTNGTIQRTHSLLSDAPIPHIHIPNTYDAVPTTTGMHLVNKMYERAINPFLPPERSLPYRTAVPINIPTRGMAGEYQQVGILTDDDNEKILPLYGRPTHPGSNKWNYYTSTDKFHQVKLPIHSGEKNCTGEYGCNEVDDSDEIKVPAYGKDFKATLYELDAPRYIPL
jgi:hypothetical protein